MTTVLLLNFLLMPPADSVQKQVGLQAHTGFIIPHAPDLRAIAQTHPVGLELTFDRIIECDISNYAKSNAIIPEWSV